MTQFRLLHITDLHFSYRERGADVLERFLTLKKREVLDFLFQIGKKGFFSSHDKYLAQFVAEFAYDHRAELDAILVSGDLATTGLPADLSSALEFLEAPAVTGALTAKRYGTLAASQLPVALLPGNHDRYKNEWGDAGATTFENVFAKYWMTNSRVQLRLLEREGTGLGLLLIDLTLRDNLHAKAQPLPFSYLGQGKAYADTLAEAAERTKKLRERAIAVAWVVHFPPEIPGGSPYLELLNGRDLISAAKDSGVSHIFAGHIHQQQKYSPPNSGITVFSANSPCSTTEAGTYGFQILNIDVDSSSIKVHEAPYLWHQGRKEFLAV